VVGVKAVVLGTVVGTTVVVGTLGAAVVGTALCDVVETDSSRVVEGLDRRPPATTPMDVLAPGRGRS
jgi:hypothetical protein